MYEKCKKGKVVTRGEEKDKERKSESEEDEEDGGEK